MTIQDIFECYYSDQHSIMVESVKSFRLGNGSYSLPNIARAYRNFKAGFEANSGGSLRIIGFLSHKGLKSASESKGVFFNSAQTQAKCIAVYVKDDQ